MGLYIDGVYMARSIGGTMDFLDLERIEVLRGPQGTLFGRNTIGGAIAVHTVRPDDQFGGSVEAQVGSDDMLYLTGDINIPITDNLFSKIRHYPARSRRLYRPGTTRGPTAKWHSATHRRQGPGRR